MTGGGAVDFYVNGTKYVSLTGAGPSPCDTNIYLGSASSNDSDGGINGYIDDAFMFNSVITQDQIRKYYYAGARIKSKTKLENNKWYNISGLFAFGTASLGINGETQFAGVHQSGSVSGHRSGTQTPAPEDCDALYPTHCRVRLARVAARAHHPSLPWHTHH